MKRVNSFIIWCSFLFALLPVAMTAQDNGREVYGWLRYDEYDQEEYGVCKFNTNNPGDIKVIYPHDQTEVACAAAFADGSYYVYLYKPDGAGNAYPHSFNRVNLSNGEMKQVADYRGMSTLFQDMAYDYSTQTMYALGYNENTYMSLLLVIDLANGNIVSQKEINENKFVALACSYDGQLYGIDVDNGDFWSIDKNTGEARSIGYTGERVSEQLQSMEFDHETNVLYWAGDNFWGTVDISTGAAEYAGSLGNYAQVLGLYIPFKKTDAEAPAEITDLRIKAGEDGALSAELTWTNPSLNYAGDELASLAKIEIYRDEQLIHTIDNPVKGRVQTWTDMEIQKSGFVTYRLSAVNGKGDSSTDARSVFVGRDVPEAVSRLSLTALTENSAKLTWAAPEKGLNSGWIDAATLTYKITRLPDETVVAEAATGNEYTDNSITVLNAYSYRVEAVTRDGIGGEAVTNRLVMGPPLTVPYYCNFATDEQFALWNVIDANNDEFTWRRETTLAAAYYYYNEDGETGGDDWLISSPIHLEKGKIYRLNFSLQAYGEDVPEKVSVYLGTGKTVDKQTTALGMYDVRNETFIGHKVILPEDLETGDYHISYHCTSAPNMYILYVTNVLLEEVSEGGISGVVTDGQNPLEGVEVFIKDSDLKTTTDADGTYGFKELKTGNYVLGFDKEGYRYVEKADVAVTYGETAIVDVTLKQLPVYAVSGKLLNKNNRPVGKAKVTLTGYAGYVAESAADGTFAFPAVYQADGYELVAERYGLCNDTLTVDVKDADIVLEDIVLEDKPLPPYSLTAEVQDGQVKLEWKEPVDTRVFRHDNGIHGGRLGTTGSTAKSVYGSVFRTPAKLTGMTWFTENYLMTHPTVNVFVFDLNADGEPTSRLLYSKMNVPNKDLEWTSFDFPEPVNAPNGYMLALSYEGHVGLGLDTGEGAEYPFVGRTNCYAEDYTTGNFVYTEVHDIRRSLMIRGIGILEGEDTLPSATTDKSYSVWRLKTEQKDAPEQWSLLTAEGVDVLAYTDTEWASQQQGFYCYAVRTVYNNGNLSSPAVFTQELVKDMQTRITIRVNTNTPSNESKGAKVVLTNADGAAEHVYIGTVDAQGKVLFADVWKGLYKVEITLKGFGDYVAESEDFSTENSYDKSNYVLKEYIVNPFNLEVVKTGKERERKFNWNVTDCLFDDFEACIDFAVNPEGSVGWTYVDGDGQETIEINGVKYINATLPKAYMAFNPYATDPNIAFQDPAIRPYSGEKYLAAFPVRSGANDDYIISPELNFKNDFVFKFYAKSYTDQYGLERVNVGYSVTDNQPESFIRLNGDTPMEVPAGDWKEYKYTIPAGAKYVTVNCVSDNAFIFMVDDVFIGMELPEGVEPDKMKEDIAFEVYLDGKKLQTTKQTGYLLSGLEKGKHTAGVKAVFSSLITPMVETEFIVEEESGLEENRMDAVVLFPNPAKDIVTVSGEYDCLSLFDLSGDELSRYVYGEQINVQDLPEGVYLVRVISGNQVKVAKLVVDK